MALLSSTLSRAGSADALVLPAPSVLGRELMSVVAMGLRGVLRRKPNAANDVLALGHRLQMAVVDACPITAEMVELQPVRNGPNEMLVRPAVSCDQASAVSFRTERAVAAASECSSPHPASGVVDADVMHESFSGRKPMRSSRCGERVSGGFPSLVVLQAPPSNYLPRAFTSINRTPHSNESLTQRGWWD
jgi:hypothetical protein